MWATEDYEEQFAWRQQINMYGWRMVHTVLDLLGTFEEVRYSNWLFSIRNGYSYGSGGGGSGSSSGREGTKESGNGVANYLALLKRFIPAISIIISWAEREKREYGIAFIKDKDGKIRYDFAIAMEKPNELHWNYRIGEGETLLGRIHTHYERDGVKGVDAFSVFDRINGGGDLMSAINGYDQSKGNSYFEAMISTESNILYILEISTKEQRNNLYDGIFKNMDLCPWDDKSRTACSRIDYNYINNELNKQIYGNFHMIPIIYNTKTRKVKIP